MARHAYRASLGSEFSEGARQLWLVVETRYAGNQAALALALEADPGLVSRWLYGDRRPGLDWALKVAAQFGVDAALWRVPPAAPFTPPGGRDAGDLQPTGTER